MNLLLRQLEGEAYEVMMGSRRAFSIALFDDLVLMWQAWQHGIPPVAGRGVLDLPLALIGAFGVLDRARARADESQRERARDG